MKKFFLLLIIFFIGCETYDKYVPTEFFKIGEKSYIHHTIEEREPSYKKLEYFVLFNPPNDTSLLKKIVEEYNHQTMSIDTIQKYFAYEREFYRETQCLTRNYEEGKPYPNLPWWTELWDFPCESYYHGDYPGQQIMYHRYGEGYLMNAGYVVYSTGDWEYGYQFGRKAFGDTIFYERTSTRIKGH